MEPPTTRNAALHVDVTHHYREPDCEASPLRAASSTLPAPAFVSPAKKAAASTNQRQQAPTAANSKKRALSTGPTGPTGPTGSSNIKAAKTPAVTCNGDRDDNNSTTSTASSSSSSSLSSSPTASPLPASPTASATSSTNQLNHDHNNNQAINNQIDPRDLKLLQVIGRGTFAHQVALAQHTPSQRLVVVKTLNKQLLRQRKQIVHTLTEKRVLEALSCRRSTTWTNKNDNTNNTIDNNTSNIDTNADYNIGNNDDNSDNTHDNNDNNSNNTSDNIDTNSDNANASDSDESEGFIVQLFQTFQTATQVHFVLEYCPGGELFYHLQQQPNARFDETTTQFYAAEVLQALATLHGRQIVYRDLKPENVLLDADGHVKLADFGFAKQLDTPTTRTFSFCGSPEYLSPEMVQKTTGHGLSTDMWSFGCLVYELVTGAPPFVMSNGSLPKLFAKITAANVWFPPYLSGKTISLLQQLLCVDVDARLTAPQAMDHAFFRSVDWADVARRNVHPPICIRTTSDACTQNFDVGFTQAPVERLALETLVQQQTRRETQATSGLFATGDTDNGGEFVDF